MVVIERAPPKTDKGIQAYLSNVRPPEERLWLALGAGLSVCLEPSGMKTFQARIRRQGETNPRRVRIGSFPTVSVADARRKLAEMKSLVREGRDPTVEQRRARSGVVKFGTLGELIKEYLARREGQIAAKTSQDRARSPRRRAGTCTWRSSAVRLGANRFWQGDGGLCRALKAGRTVTRD